MTNLTLYNFSSTKNTGDRYCSPHLYIPWLANVPVLMPNKWKPGTPAIFGGGGMLHPGWDHILHAAARDKTAKIVFWGIGLNYHNATEQTYPKAFKDSTALIGMREHGNPWQWVPCVSCLAPEFDVAADEAPRHRLVVFQHKDRKFSDHSVPTMTNDNSHELHDVLRLIASGRTLVTNSFHGAYWGILLQREVVLCEPFSNRFKALGPLKVCTRKDWRKAASGTPQQYRVNLHLARTLNRNFSELAKAYLEV
jgi:hypothetical protein